MQRVPTRIPPTSPPQPRVEVIECARLAPEYLDAVGGSVGQAIGFDDVMRHIDLALDGMLASASELGDDLVNARPELSGANTVFQLVAHCFGVMNHWGGAEISGRPVERDRASEFRSTGTVADLTALVERTRRVFAQDLLGVDFADAALGAAERDGFTKPERVAVATKGGVLMHVYEELAQHRGHLDITADLVRRMVQPLT